MQLNIHPHFQKFESALSACMVNFESTGKLFGDGARNKIKLFQLDQQTINIKSFKIPNLINQVAYAFFRKSKARRSYEFATTLLENGIGTPQPIAYGQNFSFTGLQKSFYVSEHLASHLTFRELVEQPDYPEHEIILRQFTKFSFSLHQKGIEFLDHSPGNTLIKKVSNGRYDFFLVDLNRMNFHKQMPFELRMRNLSRLTPKREMIAIMSYEYAKLYDKNYEDVYEKMWFYSNKFQEQYWRKRKLKKQLLFWKS